MKEYIKSYHVFLSSFWLRVVVYVIYPLVGILMITGFIGICLKMNGDAQGALGLGISLIISAEVAFGYGIFGGIVSKDTNKLEYLKTSIKGIPVLRKGLLTDVIRRSISAVLIIILPFKGCDIKIDEIDCVAVLFVMFISIEICMQILQRSVSLSVLFAVIILGEVLSGMLLKLAMGQLQAGFLAVVIPCTLLLIFYRVTTAVKKARESYYDNGFEKEFEAD